MNPNKEYHQYRSGLLMSCMGSRSSVTWCTLEGWCFRMHAFWL